MRILQDQSPAPWFSPLPFPKQGVLSSLDASAHNPTATENMPKEALPTACSKFWEEDKKQMKTSSERLPKSWEAIVQVGPSTASNENTEHPFYILLWPLLEVKGGRFRLKLKVVFDASKALVPFFSRCC